MKKHLFLPLLSGLFLCVALLSACGTGGDTTANATTLNNSTTQKIVATTVPVGKTPVTSQPTVTPTRSTTNNTTNPNTTTNGSTNNGNPGACSVTYGCGTGSSNLTPYTKGNGYTINFPGSWVIESDGSNGTIFSTPDKASSFHVFVEDSSTAINPLQYEFGTLAKSNCHAVPSGLPVTQSNSGFMWNQEQFICDSSVAGGQKQEIGILTAVDTHNNKYYNIDYIANPSSFDSVDKDFFAPMIASFKLQASQG